MSGVETVNIGATVSSVTPKIFNFTGASGFKPLTWERQTLKLS